VAEDRPRDHRGGQADEQTIKDRLAAVGADDANRKQRPRMRRDQPMHDRQTGEQRNADLDEGDADPLRDDVNEWYQEHEADLEEQRNADEKGGEHHRPVDTRKAARSIAQCTRSLPKAATSVREI